MLMALEKKLVDQLVDKELIHTFDDIFTLRFDDLVNLERMAEKSAYNILSSIEKSKKQRLQDLCMLWVLEILVPICLRF